MPQEISKDVQDLFKNFEVDLSDWFPDADTKQTRPRQRKSTTRKGAGRKPNKDGNNLEFVKRLSAVEYDFIDYAREHNLNFDELMQG